MTDWSRNIFTENTTNGIRIASFGNDSSVLSAYGTVYYIDSNVSISAGRQVEIGPGVVVKLKNGSIQVEGSFVLKGTVENPVIFTSIKDDSVGGDTDGVIATPQKGDWKGIHVYKGAEVTCNYSKFYYGGYYHFQYGYSLFANEGQLEIQNSELSSVFGKIIKTTGDVILKQTILANGEVGVQSNGQTVIKSCKFTNNNNCGIYINSGQTDVLSSIFEKNNSAILHQASNVLPYIRNNNFIGNQYAIDNRSATTIDCTWNYWGHTDGPSTLKEDRTWTAFGDKINGKVNFAPWFDAQRTGQIEPAKIVIEGVIEGQKTNQDPAITITVTDGVLKSVQIDEEPWEMGQPIAEGQHTLRVVAENFQNEEREVLVHFSLDKTPPVAVIDNGLEIRGSIAGGPVTFQATGSTDNSKIITYEWKFSDGLSTGGSTPKASRRFETVGEYTVTLTVKDDHGNVSEPVEARIIIEDAVNILITGVEDGQKATTDLPINVEAQAGELIQIMLDQTIMEAQQFVVSAEGKHTLTVTAKSLTEAETRKTINFSIDKTPPVARLAGGLTAFINEESSITGTSYDNMGIEEYVWTISDDQNEYSGTVLKKIFTQPGEYSISLRVKDTHGNWCAEPATAVLHVIYRTTEVSFEGIKDGQKFNRAVPLNIQVNYGTIQWISLNGQSVENCTEVSGEGSHTVVVLTVNENGEEKQFTVGFSIDLTAPVADIDRSVPISAFNDDKAIEFVAGKCTDNTGIESYQWTFSGSEQIYSGPIISRGFTNAGNYTVTLIVLDGYGNKSAPATLDFVIKEKGNTGIQFSGAEDKGQYNHAVTVQISVTDGALKRWILNGQEITGETVTVSGDGSHSISAEAANDQGYTLAKGLRFTIDTTPPVANAGPDRTITEGNDLILNGNGKDLNGIAKYKWIFNGDGQEIYSQQLVKKGLTPGEYTAQLWVSDMAGNWCTEPDSVFIKVGYRPAEVGITGVYPNMRTNEDVTIGLTVNYGEIQSALVDNQPYTQGETITSEGRHILRVVAVNQAQEISETTVIFTIDRTVPIAEAGVNRKCFNDGQPLLFDGRPSMDDVGIAKYEWTFSDTGEKKVGPMVYKGFTQVGKFTVTLVVTDMAGNVSAEDTCQVEVADMGNIRILVSGVEDGGRYNQDVLIGVEVQEGSLQKILIDKIACLGSEVTVTQSGHHSLTVEAVNDSGYLMTKTWDFLVDKTAPIPDGGGDRKGFVNHLINFNGVFSYDLNGIAEYRWEFCDGQIQAGRSVNRSFSQAGEYHVDLFVKDNLGNWSPEPNRMKITIKDPGELSVLTVSVTDFGGAALKNAIVILEDTQGKSFKYITDYQGRISELVDEGGYKIYLYHPGFKSLTRDISIGYRTSVEQNFALEQGSDIITVAESRQLDLNEIRELGIDTSAPENRFIFKFEFRLEYMECPIEVLSNMKDKKFSIPQKEEKTPQGGMEAEVNFPDPRIAVILIRGEASVLKEFHEMSVTVINAADPSVSFDETQFLLHLPKGLSLAPIPEEHQTTSGHTILKQSLLVEAGSIPGQSQKQIKWVLRGDEPGSYNPTVDYFGVLNPFEVEISDTVEPKDPIQIADPANLVLRAAAPDLIFANETFTVTVELYNAGKKPFYDAQLMIDEIDVKYMMLLTDLKTLFAQKDCLNPGEKISVNIDFLPLFSGICTIKDLKQIGGNATFSTAVIPDCPRLFTAVETDDGKVSLEWLPPGDAFYYVIRRRKAGEEEFRILCSESYGEMYVDTNVENFQPYEYIISSVNMDGLESIPSQIVSAVPGKITASPMPGFYNGSQRVELSAGQGNARLYYTTDGNTPVAGSSNLYADPLTLSRYTVVKAIAVNGQAVSKVFEFIYYFENAIYGDFVDADWSDHGMDGVARENAGNQYRLTLPTTKVFDWPANDLPVSYLRQMPAGSWTAETCVSLESFSDGTTFSAGMFLTNGSTMVSWGFERGTNLLIRLGRETVEKKISFGQSYVYLRIRKERDMFSFEYRSSLEESWHVAVTLRLEGATWQSGVYGRTWNKARELAVLFDGYRVGLLPEIDPVWEWQRPMEGPDCQAEGRHNIILTVPATRAFNWGNSSDPAPRLVRRDMGEGDWRFVTRVDLLEATGNDYLTGILINFGNSDRLFWGRQGAGLAVRRPGKGNVLGLENIPNGPVSLMVQRNGFHYIFSYRTSETSTWTSIGGIDVALPVSELGLITLTWSSPQRVVSRFTGVELAKIVPPLAGLLPDDWEWVTPITGPTYSVDKIGDVQISVPSDKKYPLSATADEAPKLSKDLLAGGFDRDWVINTRATLEEYKQDDDFHSGLMVAFDSNAVLQWGFFRGPSLRGFLDSKGVANVANANETMELQIRKEGTSYALEYRTTAYEPWQLAKKITIDGVPQKAGWMTRTTKKCRVVTKLQLPTLKKVVPRYEVNFNVRHAMWDVGVSNAYIQIDQGVPQFFAGSITTEIDEGIHTYRVFAPGYSQCTGQVEVNSSKTVDVLMQPETELPSVQISSVDLQRDELSGQLCVGIKLKNYGADTRLWIRFSLMDADNNVQAVLGGTVNAATGENVRFSPASCIFRLSQGAAWILTEIFVGDEQGERIAVGETPVQ